MTRKEQIRNKARELGQQYFPDSANIWARSNVEAVYVENACVEMAEWIDRHPDWIPVEERLPEEEDLYIVSNGKETSVAYWVEDAWDSFGDVITHWMSLPQLPGKEDKLCQ